MLRIAKRSGCGRWLSSGKSLAQAADKADMDEKTARKYRRLGDFPRDRSRTDVADTNRPVCRGLAGSLRALQAAPGLEAKDAVCMAATNHSGKFRQLAVRQLQRGVKRWRATAGPAKEVFFSQVHHPGRLCASISRT